MPDHCINLQPRRMGNTEAIIQSCKITLLEGKSCTLLYTERNDRILQRYQDRLRELGVDTIATEATSTSTKAIWTHDRFEPYINGFITETKFSGYILTIKKI